MSLLKLVHRNLWRHPVRTCLTFGFSALALFLFVFLTSVVTTLDAATKAAATNRIAVQSAASLYVYMPESYRPKIEQVPGVESTCPWVWFGGYYQDPRTSRSSPWTSRRTDQYPEAEEIRRARRAPGGPPGARHTSWPRSWLEARRQDPDPRTSTRSKGAESPPRDPPLPRPTSTTRRCSSTGTT
jgi:hypothetical protein